MVASILLFLVVVVVHGNVLKEDSSFSELPPFIIGVLQQDSEGGFFLVDAVDSLSFDCNTSVIPTVKSLPTTEIDEDWGCFVIAED